MRQRRRITSRSKLINYIVPLSDNLSLGEWLYHKDWDNKTREAPQFKRKK